MARLDEIEAFAKVAQCGSFTKAARLLGTPTATVSRKVAGLEKRLGVTLIHRTTRRLNVTQAGSVYFKHCLCALQEIDSGEKELHVSKSEPEGLLRILAPVEIGHTMLPPIVQAYLRTYPKTQVQLTLRNRTVNLVDHLVVEGIDLAIWPGPFKDSTLVTRKLKDVGVFFWASRSYVKRYGVPRHPRDLAKHSVVGYVESPTFYNLSNGRKTIKAAFQARLIVDDLETAKTFVMAGEYIGLLPNFLCKTEAKERKIRKVLDGWSYEFRPGPGTLSFIYPPQRYISPKIRAFIDLAIRRESAASAVYVAKPAEASLA